MKNKNKIFLGLLLCLPILAGVFTGGVKGNIVYQYESSTISTGDELATDDLTPVTTVGEPVEVDFDLLPAG